MDKIIIKNKEIGATLFFSKELDVIRLSFKNFFQFFVDKYNKMMYNSIKV